MFFIDAPLTSLRILPNPRRTGWFLYGAKLERRHVVPGGIGAAGALVTAPRHGDIAAGRAA
ncbi:MAG TPA: hypothetical protein VNZ53_46075 [Steroidobacteraceae bacterium]|nr:hypothetical protein [Steroidobacteraceae bacterium]